MMRNIRATFWIMVMFCWLGVSVVVWFGLLLPVWAVSLLCINMALTSLRWGVEG